MDIKSLRIKAREILKMAEIDDWETDADILLSQVLNIDKSILFSVGENEVSQSLSEDYMTLVKRRATHVPLQHILGSTWFYQYEFIVNEHVLIPRQETEILVDEARKLLKPDIKVLDLCTGSGCIIISLACLNNNQGDFFGSDISKAAIETAKMNMKKNNVNIHFFVGDMTLPIPKDLRFDIITANPPYIPEEQIEGLTKEVRLHDPYGALWGGKDGLLFYRQIASSVKDFMNPNGRLILEIGFDQAKAVTHILQKSGFYDINVIKDYSDKDRVITAKG